MRPSFSPISTVGSDDPRSIAPSVAMAGTPKPVIHEAFDVAEITKTLSHVELARPMETQPEVNRDFADADAMALDHQLKPDLVSDRVELVRGQEGFPPKCEESARGIPHRGQRPSKRPGDQAVQPAKEFPALVDARALDVAGAKHEVDPGLRQRIQQTWNRFWRMTEVGIHDQEDLIAGQPQTVDHGATEASFSISHHELHPSVLT